MTTHKKTLNRQETNILKLMYKNIKKTNKNNNNTVIKSKSPSLSELQSSFQNSLGTTDWQTREITEEHKIEAGQKGRVGQDRSGIRM